MDTPDDVREAKVHSISLRRPRAKKRATTPPPGLTSRIAASIRSTIGLILTPPQQSFLALLGLSSLAMKVTERTWHTLVKEGIGVNAQISTWVEELARRAVLPLSGRPKPARQSGSADA